MECYFPPLRYTSQSLFLNLQTEPGNDSSVGNSGRGVPLGLRPNSKFIAICLLWVLLNFTENKGKNHYSFKKLYSPSATFTQRDEKLELIIFNPDKSLLLFPRFSGSLVPLLPDWSPISNKGRKYCYSQANGTCRQLGCVQQMLMSPVLRMDSHTSQLALPSCLRTKTATT